MREETVAMERECGLDTYEVTERPSMFFMESGGEEWLRMNHRFLMKIIG